MHRVWIQAKFMKKETPQAEHVIQPEISASVQKIEEADISSKSE
jgi:hypothetical protein